MGLDTKQRSLILESEISALVFGVGERFALFPVTEDEDDAVQRGFIIGQRGYKFCGVLALHEGRPAVLLATDNPMAAVPIVFAALEFIEANRDYLQAHDAAQLDQAGDSVDSAAWLTTLFKLPDDRLAN